MSWDLVFVGLLLLFALHGRATGAIRQLTHWAGLACGALLAKPAAAQLTPVVAPRLGWPAALVRVGLASLLFAALAGLGGLIVHAVLSKMAGGREDGPINRAVGAGLGLTKGAAVLFASLSVLLFFEKPLAGVFKSGPKVAPDSVIVAFVRGHNLFEVVHLSAAARLEKLLAAMRDPAAARAAAADPELKGLMEDPALKSALKDEGLAQALRSGDLSALKDDPKIAALLKDPRLAAELPR